MYLNRRSNTDVGHICAELFKNNNQFLSPTSAHEVKSSNMAAERHHSTLKPFLFSFLNGGLSQVQSLKSW